MSVKYTPRKFRSFRQHKQPAVGHRLDHRLKVGQQGVFAADYGQLNWRIIETGRRFLARQFRRRKVWIRYTLTQPLTAKSSKARMGGGKGKFRGWTGYIRPGSMMYEMQNPVPRYLAERAGLHTRISGQLPLEKLKQKFPFALKIVRAEQSFRRWQDYGLRHRPARFTARRASEEPRRAELLHREAACHDAKASNWLGFFHRVWLSQRSWFANNHRRLASRLNWIALQQQQRREVRTRRRLWLSGRLGRLRAGLLPGHFYSFTLLITRLVRRAYPEQKFAWTQQALRRHARRRLSPLFRVAPVVSERWSEGLRRRLLFLERLWQKLDHSGSPRRRGNSGHRAARRLRRCSLRWRRRTLLGKVGPKRKKRKGDFWIAEQLIPRVRLLLRGGKRFRPRSVLWLGTAVISLFRWRRWRHFWLAERRRCGYHGQWATDFTPFPPLRRLQQRRYSNRELPRWFRQLDRRVRRRRNARQIRLDHTVPRKMTFHLGNYDGTLPSTL